MKIMMKLTAGCAFENWDEAKADEVNLEAVGGCLGCFEEVCLGLSGFFIKEKVDKMGWLSEYLLVIILNSI